MNIAVIALTKNGSLLAAKIGEGLECQIYLKEEWLQYLQGTAGSRQNPNRRLAVIPQDFKAFVGEVFRTYRYLIFIMACGIVVRSIAPFLINKRKDPGVLVLDEKGSHVISLLSGHVGGANELAEKVAGLIGGQPVITTASDVNGLPAWDVVAKKNNCILEDAELLKRLTAQMLRDGYSFLYSDVKVQGLEEDRSIRCYDDMMDKLNYVVAISHQKRLPLRAENILYLRPQNLILGIGCKKGTTKEDIRAAVTDFLEHHNVSKLSLKTVASIDIKKNEAGILEFCEEWGISPRFISGETIKTVQDRFQGSPFVYNSVGVPSVAEPCAVLGGKNAVLKAGKKVYPGITLALAEEETVIYV